METCAPERSTDGHRGTETEHKTVPATHLHGNLMRSMVNRDPMEFFEVLSILGDGSMGSVSKVRKHKSAIGGSARLHGVADAGGFLCFPNIFAFCLAGRETRKAAFWESESTKTTNESITGSARSAASGESGRFARKQNSMISYTSREKEVMYALKSIHLDRCTSLELQEELKNEVAILRSLDHPNIVRAIETFQYQGRLFIALELCSGGDLYTRDPYSVREALKITSNLLSAVSYLHSQGIIHRDLKFENVMFTTHNRHAEVKIIDFGLSKKFAHHEYMKDTVGTVYTMCPELLAGRYNEKADVWSIGVLAFMLLSSSMPFYGKHRTQVLQKIARGKFHFSSRRWKHVPQDAKDFCKALLTNDPDQRPSAEEAIRLPWLYGADDSLTMTTELNMMDLINQSIQAFVGYGHLKKLGLMVIAYRTPADELSFLRRMFNRFDKLKNGVISTEEFAAALSIYEYKSEDVEALYKGIDIDGTGCVHYIEFLASTLESLGPIEEERIADAFDRIDSDDSGFITLKDLRDFLGEDLPETYLERIIEEADIVHDNRISYDEFLELWNVDYETTLNDGDKPARRIISREPSFSSTYSSSAASEVTNSRRSLGSSIREAPQGLLV